jgi:hypothetical protein
MVTYYLRMDTPTLTREIAARVTEAMRDTATTRNGLANAIGTPRTTLNRKLEGHTQFTILELVAISKHTNKPLGDFLPIPDLTGAG